MESCVVNERVTTSGIYQLEYRAKSYFRRILQRLGAGGCIG